MRTARVYRTGTSGGSGGVDVVICITNCPLNDQRYTQRVTWIFFLGRISIPVTMRGIRNAGPKALVWVGLSG